MVDSAAHPFPGSAFGYRSKDEETSWRDRDPIAMVERHLRRRGLYTDDELATVHLTPHAFHGEWNYTLHPRTVKRC